MVVCPEQVAVISDIHGNGWALEAVLEDIAHRHIQAIVNLGDSLYGPLDPARTADTLMSLKLPTVRGNEDRIIMEPPDDSQDSSTLRFVRGQLNGEHLQWLRALELTCVVFGTFRMCHGSPERDHEYLLQEISPAGATARNIDQLAAKVDGVLESVILCGHDHIPRTVRLPDARLIVNPGSIGCPAYVDDYPFPHAMQAGTPHAHYAVITRDKAGWRVDDVAVSYDWETAANTAEGNGRPDWARWLRTGRAENL